MAFLFTEVLVIFKTRAIKLKIQERQMTSTSLLISPGFDLERELYNTSVLSSHT